jgi:hypothetical protein
VEPKDAIRKSPNWVLYVSNVRHPIVKKEKIPAIELLKNFSFDIKIVI